MRFFFTRKKKIEPKIKLFFVHRNSVNIKGVYFLSNLIFYSNTVPWIPIAEYLKFTISIIILFSIDHTDG